MPNEINVALTAGRRSLSFSDEVIADYASVLLKANAGKGYQYGATLPKDTDKQTVTALRSEAQGLSRRIKPNQGHEFTVRTVKGEDGSQSMALVVIPVAKEGN